MERAMGIDPTAQAWEAWVLPLYDARSANDSSRVAAAEANRTPCFKLQKKGARRRLSKSSLNPGSLRRASFLVKLIVYGYLQRASDNARKIRRRRIREV